MSESKRARVDRTSLVRGGVHDAREGEESRAREEERSKRDERMRGEKKNGQPVTPRSARPGLDNRDVSRAKNRPGTPGPVRLQSSSAFALESRGHAWAGERASERAAAAAAGHAEVNGCSARERFFGPENVRRGCQPGYLVRGARRAGARHGHSAARVRAKSRVAARVQGARAKHAGLSALFVSLSKVLPSVSALAFGTTVYRDGK